VISPKLAAIGVATLSGLILKQRETTMTVAVIKPAEETQYCQIIVVVIIIIIISISIIEYCY
jgi:hypothetical protein